MSKPEKVFKMGAVRASVFSNIIKKDGEEIPLRKVVLEVRYRDKRGEWKGSRSLSLNELPKAIAAAEKLRAINSQITVQPLVADVTATNIDELAGDVDLIVDGTDNFETRYLVNDYAVKHGLPWVFGGCIGAEGQTMTILPGETACLACLMPAPPPPGVTPTCDTAGVLGSAVNIVASIEAAEAMIKLEVEIDHPALYGDLLRLEELQSQEE